jgi:hypothetical protein
MELLTMHGISSLDPNVQKHVIRNADKLEYEPWQIQIGPELWRRFLNIVKGMDIPRIVMALSMKSPDEAHEIVEAIIQNPEHARALLTALIQEPEPEPEMSYNPEDDDTGEEWKKGIRA